MSDDALIYEYATVRYVPRVEREEFINVGLLMVCKRKRWLRCEMKLNEQRLRALDPQVDIEMLSRQLEMFNSVSTGSGELTAEERFRWLSAVKSCVLQTSRTHPGLIEVEGSGKSAEQLLEEHFSRMMKELVL